MEHALMQYSPEMETFEQDAFDFAFGADRSGESGWAGEGVTALGEHGEMELAVAALEVSGEAGLASYLRRLVRQAEQATGKPVGPAVGRALVDQLMQVARKVLPAFVRRDGPFVPTATRSGTPAAVTAGRLFGLELEGLSPEDQEYETAKQFARFAAEAVRHAALAQAASPQDIARAAVARAARRYAPGLLKGRAAVFASPAARLAGAGAAAPPGATNEPCLSGRWVRQGRTIIIANC
jgi:hypothetical protein